MGLHDMRRLLKSAPPARMSTRLDASFGVILFQATNHEHEHDDGPYQRGAPRFRPTGRQEESVAPRNWPFAHRVFANSRWTPSKTASSRNLVRTLRPFPSTTTVAIRFESVSLCCAGTLHLGHADDSIPLRGLVESLSMPSHHETLSRMPA